MASDTIITKGPELLADLAKQLQTLLQTTGMDRDVAEQIACHAAQHIADHWGGQNAYIPKGHQFKLSKRDIEIWNAFTGSNVQELARRFDLSVTWVYKILKRMRRADRSQLSLFPDVPDDG